jgi:hypothetical protein
MKKLLLLCSFGLLLAACKQKETPQQKVNSFVNTETPKLNICAAFDTLQHLNTQGQVLWLRANQNQICATQYDSCRVVAHQISQTDYDHAIDEFWGTRRPVQSEFTLAQIKSLPKEANYNEFIECTTDDKDIITLNTVFNFTVTPNCYSVPLFYSIDRFRHLNDTDVFVFTRAKINNTDTVIFTISGSNDFYDASSFPL